MTNPNDDWEGASTMHKALKALATSVRPISASRVKTAAATAIQNVKVRCASVWAPPAGGGVWGKEGGGGLCKSKMQVFDMSCSC